MDKMGLKGVYEVIHRDINGKEKSREVLENLVTNEGFDYLLDASLHGGTAISTWYFAPFKDDITPTTADTYASPSYTELAGADTSEGARQEWAEGASSGQSITNATAATITAAGAFTVYGIGIVGGGSAASTSADAVGGGTLFSSAAFTTSKTLASGETLDLTYTISKA